MSKYSCKCPAPGCDFVLTVEGNDWEDVFKKMFEEGGLHIVEMHPDFPDLGEEGARKYALKNMKRV